jgi:hypothetical protein
MNRIERNLTPNGFAELLCAQELGPDLGRVGFKFVRDMLVGINRTRSVNLTDIAKGLKENIRLHATHKRLSRNLDNPALAANLSDRLLKLGVASMRSDTRLIVHMYELNKKYARKVEYLPEPGLDSDAGFKVCEILASHPDSERYTPLLATVWSDKVPGYISDAEEIKKALRRVVGATGDKGMFYFDDHSLPGRLLQPIITRPDFNFIAMMQGAGIEVLYQNEIISLRALVESAETPYGRTMFKLIPEGAAGTSKSTDIVVFIHAGAMAVKLPGCDRNLRLIALKAKNRFTGKIAVPMLTSETNLRSRKALMGLVESFLSIQDVLEAHQSLRDSFDPASFRVLTYDRLQLLMTLLRGVIFYEVSMAGNVSISDRQFSMTPHHGDVNRTYILPRHQQA